MNHYRLIAALAFFSALFAGIAAYLIYPLGTGALTSYRNFDRY